MSDELIQIDPEFIMENLCRPRQKSCAPYSQKDRFKRRQEVYRLHFEFSYNAVKIAELMKANRNTINNDIKYWYSRLAKEWQSYDINAWTAKQLNRLEMQRSRLREELENHKELESKLSIERLILEIDDKIIKIMQSISRNNELINEQTVSYINTWMKQNNLEQRFVGRWSLEKLNPKQYEKVKQILNTRRNLP